jgi:hypothetical protein
VIVWSLARGTEQLQFRSENSAEIRDWVSGHAGIEVPLLAGSSSSLRLIGASASPGSAAIACRIGDREAKLFVTEASPGAAGEGRHVPSFVGKRSLSWVMRGQLYTLA